MINILNGKGMYIWIVQRCGEPHDIAIQAQSCGLSHMVVKIADGILPYYGANDFNDHSRDWSMELIQELKAIGIKVMGWQYVYGIQSESEAEIASQRIQQAGIDIFDIDAEKEYKAPGMGAKAIKYCSKLKSLVPQVKLGLGTYRYPTYHPEFPWGEFGQYVDFYMPQVYWAGSHNPVEQLSRCLREYSRLPYPNKPIYPTGAAYREYGWQPGAGEITAFMLAARDIYKLQAANLWEWYDAKILYPNYIEELSAINYGDPVPPPSKTQLRVTSEALNIRSTPSVYGQIVGILNKGDIIEVLDVTGTEAWVKHSKGWSAANYSGYDYLESV